MDNVISIFRSKERKEIEGKLEDFLSRLKSIENRLTSIKNGEKFMEGSNTFIIEINVLAERSPAKGYGPRHISKPWPPKERKERYVIRVNSSSFVEAISIFRQITGYRGKATCSRSLNEAEDLAAFDREKDNLKFGEFFK